MPDGSPLHVGFARRAGTPKEQHGDCCLGRKVVRWRGGEGSDGQPQEGHGDEVEARTAAAAVAAAAAATDDVTDCAADRAAARAVRAIASLAIHVREQLFIGWLALHGAHATVVEHDDSLAVGRRNRNIG